VRVTVMHNPTAGDEDHSADHLSALIAAAGHDVRYQSLDDDGWQRALDEEVELVAIAGGDGSIGKVFRELSTRPSTATILPLGSANNIARALGIADAEPAELIRRWQDGQRQPFYLGEVAAPDGDWCFVESAGGGLFAETLVRSEVRDDVEDKVELGLRLLRELVDELGAEWWGLHAAGEDLSGDYLAVEAMLIGETGPNVPVAVTADPADGLLNLVLIAATQRRPLVDYLDARLRGRQPEPPALRTVKARQVRMQPPGGVALRIDDETWDASPWLGDGTAVLTAGERSVQLLVP
jgi:diacylglycerol kinase (ATP)